MIEGAAQAVMSFVMLSVIDDKWKDHLYDLDHLKASISFRGWGQKDPLVEYKQEAYEMFVGLMTELRKSVAQFFFRAQFGVQQQQPRQPAPRLQYTGLEDAPGAQLPGPARMQLVRRQEPAQPAGPATDEFGMARGARTDGGVGGPMAEFGFRAGSADAGTDRGEEQREETPVHVEKEPGRNDPCPCGSGKKYKKGHGRLRQVRIFD